jgi:predicted PurR-regulated permease PerM
MPLPQLGYLAVERSRPSTLQIIAITAAAVLAVWLLSGVLLALFLAVLIASILCGLSRWIARRTGVPRRIALLAVSALLAALSFALAYSVIPPAAAQTVTVWNTVHGQFIDLMAAHQGAVWQQWILRQLDSSTSAGGATTSSIKSFLSVTAGGLITLGVMLVTALYFALEPDLYLGGIVRLFPRAKRARVREILEQAAHAMRMWSAGQFVEMSVVGILTAIGLSLLHLPMALGLAALAGLFTFVPYFGAVAAAIPALIIGLSVGWRTAFWVLIVFICCHIIDSYLVAPFVQRRTVRLPPALTILSMTVMGTIFGPLGAVLGAPMAAVLLVFVREAYVGDVLGDRVPS